MPAHRPCCGLCPALVVDSPRGRWRPTRSPAWRFSAIAGAIVVLALHGVRLQTGSSTVNAGDRACAAEARRWASPQASPPAGYELAPPKRTIRRADSRVVGELRNPTLRVAAAAGVATHLPGLLYLLGLNDDAHAATRLWSRDSSRCSSPVRSDASTIPFCGAREASAAQRRSAPRSGRVSAWMLGPRARDPDPHLQRCRRLLHDDRGALDLLTS